MLTIPTIGMGSGALGWLPTQLGSTLKLWLRGDRGVTGASPVTAWADQSGNGNDTVAGVGSVTMTTLGGQTALQFSGASLVGSSNPVTAASDRTVFAVVKSDDDSGGAILQFRKTTVARHVAWMDLAGATTYVVGDSGANSSYSGTVDQLEHIVEVTMPGGAGTYAPLFKLDGASIVLSAATYQSESGTDGFSIGSRTADGDIQKWNGPIAELIVCDTILAAGDLTLVRDYLSLRYAIAV